MSTIKYEITNNGNTEYSEKFKNRTVVIPAGKSITMPKSEANQFLAQIATDKKGHFVEKMLSSKPIGREEDNPMICNFCGADDFKNKDEFLKHVNTHADEAKYNDKDLDKKLEEEKKKAFACPFCDFSTEHEKSLKRHIKTQHIDKPAINPEKGGSDVFDTGTNSSTNKGPVGGN